MRKTNHNPQKLFFIPLAILSFCLFVLAPHRIVVGQNGVYCPTPAGRTCGGYSVCTSGGDCAQQLFGSCCAALTPAATYPTNTPVATPTPQSWPYTLRTFYQFNDNTSSATITKSSVSPTYDGTNTNVTYTTSGAPYSGAGVFNGTSSFFSIPHSSAVSPGSQFSLSAWIKPTALTSEMAIVSKLGTVGSYSYELVTTSAGKLRLYISGDGNTISTLTSTSSLVAGTWQKATVTFDNGTVVFYINSIGETPQAAAITAPHTATGAPVYIGQKITSGSFFNGQMDEVCFYGQTLSQSEVESLGSRTCSGYDGLASYVAATGGTETTVGQYRVHTFTSSSTLVVTQGGEVEVLVVGGGGGGGMDMGGGGGGGGVYQGTFTASAQTYTITVGAGGIGAPAGGTNGQPSAHQFTIPATSGGNSSIQSANTPRSCYSLKLAGISTDGVYVIDPDGPGGNTPFHAYCDMTYNGGGWTMLMKATRGNTFGYSTNYWTSNNTLNDIFVNQNDSDAKYRSFNEMQIRDLMARWPDINSGTYRWLHNGFYAGNQTALPTFFSSVSRYFIADAKTHANWTSGIFSSQADVRFYGFNYRNNPNNARTRWGFGWNENGGGLYPNGNMDSDDVTGGIGIDGVQQNTSLKYSAGDVIGCCQDTTGINRSARVEVYGRNTSDPTGDGTAFVAYGGGFGGSSVNSYTPGFGGGHGGSGGGASGYNGGSAGGGLGLAGQGYNGGNNGTSHYSGGGGGAGGVGAAGNNQPNGGPGILSAINGTSLYWGGGGGGSGYSTCGGNGGIGGGGGGAVCTTTGGAGLNNGSAGGGGVINAQTNTPGGNAGANTGGGGGGGSHYNSNNKGGNGGSGIVIVRYPYYSSGPAATSTPLPTPTTPFSLTLSHTAPNSVTAGRPAQWSVTISNPSIASQAAWAFNLLVSMPSSVTGVVWKCEVTNVGTPRGEMAAYPTSCAGSGTAAYVDANTYRITLGHTGAADPLIHPGGSLKITVGGFIKKTSGGSNLTMSASVTNYSGWQTNALYSLNRLANSSPQGPVPTLSTLVVPTVVPISINPLVGAALTSTPTPTLYPVQPTSTSTPTPTPTLTPTPPPLVRNTCQDTNKVLRTLINNQPQYYCMTATNNLVVVKGTTVENLNGINTKVLNVDFQNGGVVNGVQLVKVVMRVQSVIRVPGASQPLARDYSLVLRMR